MLTTTSGEYTETGQNTTYVQDSNDLCFSRNSSPLLTHAERALRRSASNDSGFFLTAGSVVLERKPGHFRSTIHRQIRRSKQNHSYVCTCASRKERKTHNFDRALILPDYAQNQVDIQLYPLGDIIPPKGGGK